MTAEIAVMNKLAVALAADSAVTIGEPQPRHNGAMPGVFKTYNTINKLFTLSKYHPVGVMIYGHAEVMDVPWETIIKMYRRQLGKRSFCSLEAYATDFIEYLDGNTTIFPDNTQQRCFGHKVRAFFREVIVDEIDRRVRAALGGGQTVPYSQLEAIVADTVDEAHGHGEKCDTLPAFPPDFVGDTAQEYGDSIDEIIDDVFQNRPISATSRVQLGALAVHLWCKDEYWYRDSGIVIAGFGDEEVFPSLSSFTCEGVVNGKVRYRGEPEKSAEIKDVDDSAIVAFAQDEMAHAFMAGATRSYQEYLVSYVNRLFAQYPSRIIDKIPEIDDNAREQLLADIMDETQLLAEEFEQQMRMFSEARYVKPVVVTVAVLPKDELALMAETLVNLTLFRQRMSMDVETVGEPIDVAIISKGDGFIWVKRKHYFDANLNQHFFANYFREFDDATGRRQAPS